MVPVITAMSKPRIEELEARISYLKEDSAMCTYRIAYHTDKRSKIQDEIRTIKETLKIIKQANE